MKKVLLLLLVTLSMLCGYSQENEIVKKAIFSKLTEKDLIDEPDYFINGGEYVNYNNKLDFLVKVNLLMEEFKNMQIIYEKELNDNFLYYPAKKHVFFVVASGNDRYQIDLWFGEKNLNKIQGLTFFKYKKES
jgi:hypothetical protein